MFSKGKGKTVSFLPLCSDVINVTLEGFIYPLEGENLLLGSTRGISNIIKESQASEMHEAGIMMSIETT